MAENFVDRVCGFLGDTFRDWCRGSFEHGKLDIPVTTCTAKPSFTPLGEEIESG